VEVNLGTSPTLTLFLAVVALGYVAMWDQDQRAEAAATEAIAA